MTFHFHDDRIVVWEDYYHPTALVGRTDTIFHPYEVRYRRYVIGKILDEVPCSSWANGERAFGSDGKEYNSLYIQWKEYTPSISDPCDLTPVYDWSIYEYWFINDIGQDSLFIGPVPDWYTLEKEVPIELYYPEGFVPNLCTNKF